MFLYEGVKGRNVNPGEFSLSFQSGILKHPFSLLAREWKPRFMIMGVCRSLGYQVPQDTVVAAVHANINT